MSADTPPKPSSASRPRPFFPYPPLAYFVLGALFIVMAVLFFKSDTAPAWGFAALLAIGLAYVAVAWYRSARRKQ
jgi:hypothetical protein